MNFNKLAEEHTIYLQNIFKNTSIKNLIIVRYINDKELVYNSHHREIIYAVRDCIDKNKEFTHIQTNYGIFALKFQPQKMIPTLNDYSNILDYYDNHFRERIFKIKNNLTQEQLVKTQEIELDKLKVDDFNLEDYLDIRNKYNRLIYS